MAGAGHGDRERSHGAGDASVHVADNHIVVAGVVCRDRVDEQVRAGLAAQIGALKLPLIIERRRARRGHGERRALTLHHRLAAGKTRDRWGRGPRRNRQREGGGCEQARSLVLIRRQADGEGAAHRRGPGDIPETGPVVAGQTQARRETRGGPVLRLVRRGRQAQGEGLALNPAGAERAGDDGRGAGNRLNPAQHGRGGRGPAEDDGQGAGGAFRRGQCHTNDRQHLKSRRQEQ